MANTTNNTGITGDDIQKIKEYNEALDKLNTSLSNVNSALPKFSDGIETGLKAVAEKLPEVVSSMMKLNTQNKELEASGQKPIKVLSQLGTALVSWNTALSVGVALITTYGPRILSFIGNLFDSDKARAAAQALKDYKDVWVSYTENISKESGDYVRYYQLQKMKNLQKKQGLKL